MRLKARIDGMCELCRGELTDRAMSVLVTSHVLTTQNGEPGIKEERELNKTICPNCYAGVYRALEDR